MRTLISATMPGASMVGGSSRPGDHRNAALLDPTTKLLQTMRSNNVMRIKSAINTPCVDVNVRIPNQQQMTILMRFCYLDISAKSRKDLTGLVLTKATCDTNARDIKGRTVLMHACIRKDETLINRLAADRFVDPNIADDKGNAPIMYASRSGNANIVATLIEAFKKYGINVNRTNNEGISPLIEAARLGFTDVCRALVLIGHADVNQRDTNNNSAQDHLVVSGKSSTTDLLLLSPTVQRKLRARECRRAAGQRSFSEVEKNTPLLGHQRGASAAWTSTDDAMKRKTPLVDAVDMKRKKCTTTKHAKRKDTVICTESVPLTQEHLVRLYSVVFQVAIRTQMIVERPVEEEMEDVEKQSRKRVHHQRPRSSSLSSGSLSDFHRFVASKYGNTDYQHIEQWRIDSNMPPCAAGQNGRATLPPIAKAGGSSPRDISQDTNVSAGIPHGGHSQMMGSNPPSHASSRLSPRMNGSTPSHSSLLSYAMNDSPPSSPKSNTSGYSPSLASGDSQQSGRIPPRRRSSMPQLEDLQELRNKQKDKPLKPPLSPRRVTYPGGTSGPKVVVTTTTPDCATNGNRLLRRRGSMPPVEDLKQASSPVPSSPREPAREQGDGERTVSSPTIHQLQRRRSSMPQLSDLPRLNHQSPSSPNSGGSGGTVTMVTKPREHAENEKTHVVIKVTKSSKKSRSVNSWEGKPSTAIPSYLFR